MPYEEFKNIVSLLQSPDEEVVELGRQLFPRKVGWYIFYHKHLTELMYNGITHTTLCYHSLLPESRIKQLYADIFGI